MPLQGEYEPSPSDWVREQVEKYERSGGTRAPSCGRAVIVVTSVAPSPASCARTP